MKLPAKFKQTIAATFYDKELAFFSAREVSGRLGSITTEPGDPLETIQGNFVPQTQEAIQEIFGAQVQGSAVITCDVSAVAREGAFVVFGPTYQITGRRDYDSHAALAVAYVSD